LLAENSGEIFLVDGSAGLRGLSPLISDKYFLFLHLLYDSETLIRTFYKPPCCKKDDNKALTHEDIYAFIKMSDIQLVMNFSKQASTSIHTILKEYGLEDLANKLRNDRRPRGATNSMAS
jgi:hypothetical protein